MGLEPLSFLLEPPNAINYYLCSNADFEAIEWPYSSFWAFMA